MKKPKAHILIVEDDQAILSGLSDVLIFNGYSVKGAADGGEGLQMILDEQFDLVLLDVMLPTMDGFTICKRVREAKPAVEAMNEGAYDYVPKPFSLRELIVRVEAVLRRSGKHLGDERIECGGILFDGKNLRAQCGPHILDLTRREMDIIVYIHRHKDRIVSKKELLTEVWRYADADIETRTVDIHMLKLRKKLTTLNNQANLIQTIRGEGYRLHNE